MSHRTASTPQHLTRTPHTGRGPASGPRNAGHASVVDDFTIAHAGRQVRFGPVAFWIAVGSLMIMAGWSVMTATYFAFHDDVIKRLIARQTALQYAYEDRIADLRTEIDRTTSRQLLDEAQLEHRLSQLVHRQNTLEARADALDGIADPATTGSIGPARRGAAQRAGGPSGTGAARLTRHPPGNGEQSRIKTRLRWVDASLDRVEKRETTALDAMDLRYEDRVHQVRAVLQSLGVKPHIIPSATGGPLVPVKLPPESQGFARMVTRVNIARAQARDLDRTLHFVPLRHPIAGRLEMTSPFGVRVDPFLGSPEFHTGMDFRADIGTPVHATAAGTVAIARREGGYGNMIEINHGDGLASRYAHLSKINVKVGQKVRAGQVIGHSGSTGRSTGPHLHYEIRVDGHPVNPKKFLVAGEKLFGTSAIVSVDGRTSDD